MRQHAEVIRLSYPTSVDEWFEDWHGRVIIFVALTWVTGLSLGGAAYFSLEGTLR